MMSDGKAFLTSGIMISERLKEAAGRPELTGKMILFDFKNPSAGAQELRIKADKTGQFSFLIGITRIIIIIIFVIIGIIIIIMFLLIQHYYNHVHHYYYQHHLY